MDGKEAVWMGQEYKLIATAQESRLYNIVKDPSEKKNLAIDLPEVTQRMMADLLSWKSAVLAELKKVP